MNFCFKAFKRGRQLGVGQRGYPKGVKVSDTELDAIQITPDTFHGEWNYVISPTLP